MAPVSRRTFLSGAASAIAAPQVIASTALGAGDRPPASERVTLGHIGVGARGSHIVPWFGPEAQSVACCDPFKSRREAVARQIGGQAYADLRDLLVRDDIDAVVVETTDHWHVPAAVLAAKAGKDVYCEKPFGLCLGWVLKARDVIKQYGRVFQYGTQGLSYDGARLCAELVRSGRIGELREVHVRCQKGQSGGSGRPIPVPEDIDYDLWLGAAPWRPYCGQPMVQAAWIHINDYSVGWLGGMGS
ncbi:MAG: Gfo/Idh/MocA family protein, partial [Planctomycetota bacterium]